MKILWMSWKDKKHPLAGGAEVVASQIARRLVARGHEVIFIVGGYKNCISEEMYDGYRVIRVGGRFSVYFKAYQYYKRYLQGWANFVIDEVNTIPFFCSLYVREKNLVLKQPALLDFGAAGKGYCIDIVAGILAQKNIQSFCIDAGQDILYKNIKKEPLRVGLENPNNFEQVIGVADVCNQSICGSSGSRRKWATFHHIMHPFALESVKNIVATWAIAPTALEADALASALFFVPGPFLRLEYNFEYIILYSNFSVEKSVGFNGEVFIA